MWMHSVSHAFQALVAHICQKQASRQAQYKVFLPELERYLQEHSRALTGMVPLGASFPWGAMRASIEHTHPGAGTPGEECQLSGCADPRPSAHWPSVCLEK